VPNPFTKSIARLLGQGAQRPALDALIAHCDVIETLVIQIFRTKQTSAEDARAFAAAATGARDAAMQLADRLDPLWRKSLIGGVPAAHNPFTYWAALSGTAACIGNWEAMQTLPAMREALNELILLERGI
jgi:hypothetical protein